MHIEEINIRNIFLNLFILCIAMINCSVFAAAEFLFCVWETVSVMRILG
jgi:hypothetical protein